MDTRESQWRCIAIAFCLALAATGVQGQGLGAAAAKEKAKRERSESKPAAKVYDDASLKAQPGSSASEPASPAPSGEPATRAAGQAEEGEARPDTTPVLPVCGGFEMLRAWSEAHQTYARECGGGPREGTSGRFNIELVIGPSGRVEGVSVTALDAGPGGRQALSGALRGHVEPVSHARRRG